MEYKIFKILNDINLKFLKFNEYTKICFERDRFSREKNSSNIKPISSG